MRYIASDATSAGEGTIRVIFEPGTDPNEAVVRVKRFESSGADGGASTLHFVYDMTVERRVVE